MAPISPLYPPLPTRPRSQATRGYVSQFHPLFSVAGQNILRAELSITDWLLLGCGFQSLLVLISPLPAIYSLLPTLSLLTYKVLKIVAMTCGLIYNPHMKNVRVGRQTAIFPGPDGSFSRSPGDPLGGGEICIVLLSVKCNQ